MNKRQRKKQEKKQLIERDGLLKDIHESVARMTSGKIEVGDTVEIIGCELNGHPVGSIGIVSYIDDDNDLYYSVQFRGFTLWSLAREVKLIKKGTNQ